MATSNNFHHVHICRALIQYMFVYVFFSFTDNPRQLHVFDSSRNPRGICCLCPSSDNSLLAFPSPSSPSAVMCINLGEPDAPSRNIIAHMRPLSAISLNSTGIDRIVFFCRSHILLFLMHWSFFFRVLKLRHSAFKKMLHLQTCILKCWKS